MSTSNAGPTLSSSSSQSVAQQLNWVCPDAELRTSYFDSSGYATRQQGIDSMLQMVGDPSAKAVRLAIPGVQPSKGQTYVVANAEGKIAEFQIHRDHQRWFVDSLTSCTALKSG